MIAIRALSRRRITAVVVALAVAAGRELERAATSPATGRGGSSPSSHPEINPANLRKGLFGYGYLWRVWDGEAAKGVFDGAYSGRGVIGQYLTVLPKLDLVIAHKTRPAGGSVSWGQYMELVDRLIAARCRV